MSDAGARRAEEAITGQFAFLWRVAACGYVFKDGLEPLPWPFGRHRLGENPREGPWLTMREPDAMHRQYAPLSRGSLHRQLAKIDPINESGILTFANRYGPLTRGESMHGHWPAESIHEWAETIGKLRELIYAWELIRDRKQGPLGQHVIWPSVDRVDWQWEDKVSAARSKSVIAQRGDGVGAGIGGELISRWKFGDVIEPARYYLAKTVNGYLNGHVSPALLPFRRGDIQLFPDSLRAALFVLLALEVQGRTLPQRACRDCGNLFVPADPRQRYCDLPCKNRSNYRARKSRGIC